MVLVADDRIVRTGWVAVAAAIALSVLLAPVVEPWRTGTTAVLAVLLVALGSPHGALDHLVLAAGRPAGAPVGARSDAGSSAPSAGSAGSRSGSAPRDGALGPAPRRTWARDAVQGLGLRFVVGYVGLALLSLAAYLVVPRAGFALFLVLSVVHFAAGEVGVAVERGLARGWRDPLALVASLGGAVVVVLPLASREAEAALAAVDPRLAPVLGPLPGLAVVVSVLTAGALLGCVVAAVRGSTRAREVGLELAALTALAALAHPLLAFAAFFAFWHSLRHQARLAQVLRVGRPPLPQHQDRPLREVLDSARAGVPATVGVLLGAGALALTGATLLGGLLAVIWALTVPHSIAVAVLEVRSTRLRREPERTGRSSPAHGTDGATAASKDHDDDPTPAPDAVGPPCPARPGLDRVRG